MKGKLARAGSMVLVGFVCLSTLRVGGAWAGREGNPGPNEGSYNPASDTEGNHCVAPNGSDLNERYGVSEQIIFFACTQADSGEHWRPTGAWIMAKSFESVPPEFVPAGATPLDDFLAKFVGVKYVVDAGTRHEQTYVYRNTSQLWVGSWVGGPADGYPLVSPITMGALKPLRIGRHTVDRYWLLSALHCDGLDANLAENCLPAGESFLGGTGFEVTSGAAQSHH